MTQKKGLFIVIDGGDGSGKTVQTERLIARMKDEGMTVHTLSFPRYETPTGRVVKAYLDGAYGDPTKVPARQASNLYATDRWAAHMEGAFEALAHGVHLVANRYVASNMGHQGSKFTEPDERTAFFRWNDDLEHGFYGIPRPDLNVILHVRAEVSMDLLRKRGNALDGHENLEHLRRAEATYLELAHSYPNFALIECADDDGRLKSVEEIHELVWKQVERLCARMGMKNPA